MSRRVLFAIAVVCFLGSLGLAALGANNLARESATPLTHSWSGFKAAPDPLFPGDIGLYVGSTLVFAINPRAYQPQPTQEEFNGAASAVFWYFDHTFYEDPRGPEVIELVSPSGNSYFSMPGSPRNADEIVQESTRRGAVDRDEVKTGWLAVSAAIVMLVLGLAATLIASRSARSAALAAVAVLSVMPAVAVATFNTVTWRYTPSVAASPETILVVTDVLWLLAAAMAIALVVTARAPRRALLALPVGFLLAAVSAIGVGLARALHSF